MDECAACAVVISAAISVSVFSIPLSPFCFHLYIRSYNDPHMSIQIIVSR
jgi:hypothetical protein